MTIRMLAVLTVAAIAAAMRPAPASASGDLPLNLALGVYKPSTTNLAYPNYVPSYDQKTGFAAELSFGPILETGVQVSAMALMIKNDAASNPTCSPIPCPYPSSFTITQVPVFVETTSASFASFRLGGGLGYDFVTMPAGTGLTGTSGIVGDAFADVGLGSNLALEGKYVFGQRSGLGGLFVGIAAKL